MLEIRLYRVVQDPQNTMVRFKQVYVYFGHKWHIKQYTAQRICYQNGLWDTVINVTECQRVELDMLNEWIEDIYASEFIIITDLSDISRDLSNITDTSGVTPISPSNLNITNNILSSLIGLAQ